MLLKSKSFPFKTDNRLFNNPRLFSMGMHLKISVFNKPIFWLSCYRKCYFFPDKCWSTAVHTPTHTPTRMHLTVNQPSKCDGQFATPKLQSVLHMKLKKIKYNDNKPRKVVSIYIFCYLYLSYYCDMFVIKQ